MGIKSNLALLTNVAAAGNGPSVVVPIGGSYVYTIAGTFGGTSSKLQILGPDGVAFIDVPSTTFTAVGYVTVNIPAGSTVRSVLTGGTPSAMHSALGLVQGAS